MEQGSGLEAFLPLTILQLIMMVICWKLAVRTAMNKVLYVALMITPIVGYFTVLYMLVRSMAMIMDKLDAITPQPVDAANN